MLVYKSGDIFDSTADILVCPVNTVGVMGKGLALEFKNRFALMYPSYRAVCENGTLAIGHPWMWFNQYGGKHILCFPTKAHWSNQSHETYIELGLDALIGNWRFFTNGLGAESIAFPKLGCGLGNLEWRYVKPIMVRYLSELDTLVEIWE